MQYFHQQCEGSQVRLRSPPPKLSYLLAIISFEPK